MSLVKTSITKSHFHGETGDAVNFLNSLLKNLSSKLSASNTWASYIKINGFGISGNGYYKDIEVIAFDKGLILYINEGDGGVYTRSNPTILIKFSDSEVIIGEYSTSGSARWAYTVSNPDNYVVFAPLISVSENFAPGISAEGVYIVAGIDQSLWTANGLVVNGHTLYGAQNYCICTD